MVQPKHLSASQIKTWIDCPWKYHLRYGLGIPGEELPSMVRGKAIHDLLFQNYFGNPEIQRVWQESKDPIVREFRRYFKHPPQVEPLYEISEGFSNPRVAIPDLVSEPDGVVADLKTVGWMDLLQQVYLSDYLQIAFYRQLLPQFRRFYIVKVYWPEDYTFPMIHWHLIPNVASHEAQIRKAESEILAYWRGELKPEPRFESCKRCTHKAFCIFYQDQGDSQEG